MNKLLLSICLLFSFSVASQAATKPTDSVGVVNIVTKDGGAIELSNKNYFKPWGQLKLDQKTRTGLIAKAKTLDNQHEQFRIGFLMIYNDNVIRVVFYGNRGGIHMMRWPTGTECSLHFDGNGGFAGFTGKACYEPDEK